MPKRPGGSDGSTKYPLTGGCHRCDVKRVSNRATLPDRQRSSIGIRAASRERGCVNDCHLRNACPHRRRAAQLPIDHTIENGVK